MCPDCSEMWLEGPPEQMHCTICGWEGDGRELGRTWPMEDEGPSKRDLKLAGKLFTVRVWFEKGKDDAVYDAMEILGINGADTTGGRLRAELESRPTDETLSALRAFPGVAKVTVF